MLILFTVGAPTISNVPERKENSESSHIGYYLSNSPISNTHYVCSQLISQKQSPIPLSHNGDGKYNSMGPEQEIRVNVE